MLLISALISIHNLSLREQNLDLPLTILLKDQVTKLGQWRVNEIKLEEVKLLCSECTSKYDF